MRKKTYFFPIVIELLEEGGFLASCPVLQGCRAEGKTYGQAIENIQDVIKIHIEARKAHGEIIPEVSMPEKTDLRLTLPLPVSF
ncbi:MAG: type II toxin-antitoxin system HicB family antitoxin [Candidatus Portnoybacteria bacterium]|nr:type II toxin-antitoxin system HicB family antitoxin [Candidatus Portnoybacteria bacterium]